MDAVDRDGQDGRSRATLTRSRDFDLIRTFAVFLILAGLFVGIVDLSPVLAIAIFVVVLVGYVTSLWRREQAEQRRSGAPEEIAVVGPVGALDLLASRLSRAPQIPLSNEVRLDPSDTAALLDEVGAAAQQVGEERRAEHLRRLVLAGPSVPFAGQLRIDRQEALRVIEELRSKLAQV